MAKTVKKVVKVMAKGGAATPAPPLGPALGQAGVDIGAFVTQFNEATKDRRGQDVPVVLTVYDDRSFTFVTKQPPVASMIKEAAKISSGSGEPNKKKVGTLTRKQVEEIATVKMPDLNATTVEAAMNIVMGTARSMGVEIAA